MNILAVDTTTKIASVSIQKGEEIFSNSIDNQITHSEKLLPLIDETLKKCNLNLKDIDKFGLINGPGSFTGIRIGLATIKAFSHVYKKDIFSISSLELIALSYYLKNNFCDEKYIVSIIDAKNDRVYYSLYKVSAKNNKLCCTSICDIKNDIIDDATKNLNDIFNEKNINKDDVIYAGILGNDLKEFLKELEIHENYPTTKNLLDVYSSLEDKDSYTYNAFSLKAIYARASQAERVKNGEK